jgi:hypothetical protein
MEEKIKFGYIKVSGLTAEILKFNKKYLSGEDKFVQVKINEKNYIRVGDLFHRRILRENLNEFGLKFDTKRNRAGNEMPLERGENYELVGAGKITFLEEGICFYDCSSDYIYHIQGTDRNNLEEIFGKDKVKEIDKKQGFPPMFKIYLVKI